MISDARTGAKLTQKQLAQRVGTTQSVITREGRQHVEFIRTGHLSYKMDYGLYGRLQETDAPTATLPE